MYRFRNTGTSKTRAGVIEAVHSPTSCHGPVLSDVVALVGALYRLGNQVHIPHNVLLFR